MKSNLRIATNLITVPEMNTLGDSVYAQTAPQKLTPDQARKEQATISREFRK